MKGSTDAALPPLLEEAALVSQVSSNPEFYHHYLRNRSANLLPPSGKTFQAYLDWK